LDTIDLLRQAAGRMQAIASAAHKANEAIAELCAAIAAEEAHRGTQKDLGVLTNRQREIFDMMTQGVSVAEIAKRLKLSYRTVEAHRNTIRLRLEFTTVAELNEFAKANENHKTITPKI
jgi:DNA-binding NarL/FixJ family response regulator